MKILILGGTGVMGCYLADILSQRGDRVVVTSRSPKSSSGIIDYRQGNAKDLNFLNELLLEEWEVIVDFMIYTPTEFKQRVNLLLDATSHYIFLSSARVYDHSKEPLREESLRLLDNSKDKTYLATNEYALSKARQEDILILSTKQNWTIIRPYITYSEIRLQLGSLEKENWLYRSLKGRTIVFSKEIKESFTTLTYGLDVVDSLVKLIGNPKSFGEIFHITSDTSYRWGEILNVYLDTLEVELGFRPKVVYQNLSKYIECNSGEYQVIYDRALNRKFDNEKINSVINKKEFIDAKIGLENSLKYFLKNPDFNLINWKLEAIKDKYTNERTPLKEINGFKKKIKYILFRYFF